MEVLGQSESTVLRKLEMWSKKPSLDIDISGLLDKFLKDLNAPQKCLSNGAYNTNFAEAAMVLQNSVELYGKKVDILWNTAFDYSKRFKEYDKDREQREETVVKQIEKKSSDKEKLADAPSEDKNDSDEENGSEFSSLLSMYSSLKTDPIDLDEINDDEEEEEEEEDDDDDEDEDPQYVQELHKALKYKLDKRIYSLLHSELFQLPSNVINDEEEDEEDNVVCNCEDLNISWHQMKRKRLKERYKFSFHDERDVFLQNNDVWCKLISHMPRKMRVKFKKLLMRWENARCRQARVYVRRLPDSVLRQYFEQIANGSYRINDSNNNVDVNVQMERLDDTTDDVRYDDDVSTILKKDMENRKAVVHIIRMSDIDMLKYYSPEKSFKDGYEEMITSTPKRKLHDLDSNDTETTPKKKRKLKIVPIATTSLLAYEAFYYKTYREYRENVKYETNRTSLHNLEAFLKPFFRKELLIDAMDSGCDLNFSGFDDSICSATEDGVFETLQSIIKETSLCTGNNTSGLTNRTDESDDDDEDTTLRLSQDSAYESMLDGVSVSLNQTMDQDPTLDEIGPSETTMPPETVEATTSQQLVQPPLDDWMLMRETVNNWKTFIDPKLKLESKREAFDIHKYGTNIMDSISTSEKTYFANIVKDQPSEEVARFFAAMLQLVNTANIGLSSVPQAAIANNCLQLTLLTRDRYHEHLDDYEAPSEVTLRKRLISGKFK